MPTYVYECPTHGEFDVHMRLSEVEDEVPQTYRCQRTNTTFIAITNPPIFKARKCNEVSRLIIKPPAVITVERTWNERANEKQRNPYEQAKAQLESTYHHDKDLGRETTPPTEQSIQAAATQIAKETTAPHPDAEARHIAAQKRAARRERARKAKGA